MKQSFNKKSPFTNPLPPQDKVAQGRMKVMTLGSFVNTFSGVKNRKLKAPTLTNVFILLLSPATNLFTQLSRIS